MALHLGGTKCSGACHITLEKKSFDVYIYSNNVGHLKIFIRVISSNFHLSSTSFMLGTMQVP